VVFRRLLEENFKITNFNEEERITLILNGLKDPDT